MLDPCTCSNEQHHVYHLERSSNLGLLQRILSRGCHPSPSIPGKQLFSNVRFFERSNDLIVPVLSHEYYSFDSFRKTDITYVSRRDQLIQYKGTRVWVKDMWLDGTERAWELEQEDRQAERARKGKEKRMRHGGDGDRPKKQQKVDREMKEAVEE